MGSPSDATKFFELGSTVTLERGLAKYGAAAKTVATQEMNLIGEQIVGEAKAICPWNIGNLKKTIKVREYAKPSNLIVTIGAGDTAVGYAAAVHEAPPTRHWKHAGTSSKYLEKPVRKHQNTMAAEIAKAIKDQLG